MEACTGDRTVTEIAGEHGANPVVTGQTREHRAGPPGYVAALSIELLISGAFPCTDSIMAAQYVVLAMLVMCANTVEAITGFGSTIIAVTIGAHLVPMDALVIALVPVNVILSTYIVVRHRSATDIKELTTRMLPFTAIGLLAGLYIFSTTDVGFLKRFYGVFVLCFSIFETARILMARAGVPVKQLTLPQSVFWLIAGGVMQGIYASGGPLVVYYASRRLSDRTVFRSTLSGLWLVLNLVMFIAHLATGRATWQTVKVSAMLLPALAVGIVVGEIIHKRLPERVFRLFVFVLLMVAGGALVFV